MSAPRTFFEKVWSDHVIDDLGDNTALLQVDRLFLHELSGSVTIDGVVAAGREPASASQVFAVIEHTVSIQPGRGPNDTLSGEGMEMIKKTRKMSNEWGFTFLDVDDPRQGIVHVVSPELGVALPGLTLVCGDSHTCTVGGIGAIAWGIGTTESEHVLATQTIAQVKPKTMRVNFEGRLPTGVYAKDLILALIARHGAAGGQGYAVEFSGQVVRDMPVEGRLTICNMAVEFSARYGFVAPDEVTFAYLSGREFAPRGQAWDNAVAYWRTLPTEPGAQFDMETAIDCSQLRPLVTWGTNPQQSAFIDGKVPDVESIADATTRERVKRTLGYMELESDVRLAGIPIDAAYIGSCTNARLSDLRDAARILEGRKIAPHVLAMCVPGSTRVKREAEQEGIDQIFRDAGFQWFESGCAMCGQGGQGEFNNKRVISSTNRNFEGRQGVRTRTHLASPATVAASAIAGCLADPRAFLSTQ